MAAPSKDRDEETDPVCMLAEAIIANDRPRAGGQEHSIALSEIHLDASEEVKAMRYAFEASNTAKFRPETDIVLTVSPLKFAFSALAGVGPS